MLQNKPDDYIILLNFEYSILITDNPNCDVKKVSLVGKILIKPK